MKKALFTLFLAFVAFTSNAQLVQFTVSAGDTTQINQSVIYKVFPTSTGTNVMFLNKTSDFQTLKTVTSADSVVARGEYLFYTSDSSLILNKLFIGSVVNFDQGSSAIFYNNGRKSETIIDNRAVTTY